MSEYTTEVRFICEHAAGLKESAGYSKVNDILKVSAPKIFDFDFPIFDEEYRLPLEIKILKHYYTREICAETVGLWKLWLDQKMNEIMPIFNERYILKREALEAFRSQKIFNNVDLTTTRDEDVDGETTNSVMSSSELNRNGNEKSVQDYTGTSNAKDVSTQNVSENASDHRSNNGSQKDAYSDTPQSSLSGVDQLNYLTNYRRINNDNSEQGNSTKITTGNQNSTSAASSTNRTTGTTDSTDNQTTSSDTKEQGTSTTTRDYIEHIIGKNGGKDYLTIYQDVYNSLVNLDMEIIEELSDLFFTLW